MPRASGEHARALQEGESEFGRDCFCCFSVIGDRVWPFGLLATSPRDNRDEIDANSRE
jgi:hypothetical protein